MKSFYFPILFLIKIKSEKYFCSVKSKNFGFSSFQIARTIFCLFSWILRELKTPFLALSETDKHYYGIGGTKPEALCYFS